jgi:hypothetical protein
MRMPDFAALSPFAERYANGSGLKTVCITFDVDFAPDYMIQNVLSLLERYDAKATFFATHLTPLLQEVAAQGFHEVGLHPNLTPGTTQGTGLEDILGKLKAAYPDVVGNRFHVLGYSYRDLVTMGKSGFIYDVSTLRFNCPYLLPAWHPDLGMTLLTYSWEDGICENASLPMSMESMDLDSPGMKICNFHPMNVYINGPDSRARLEFLAEAGPLLACPQALADRHRREGPGAGTVLQAMLEYVMSRSCETLRVRDIANAYTESLRTPAGKGMLL